MGTFSARLRRVFDDFDKLQGLMSAYWRTHTNRRTLVIIMVCGLLAIGTYLGAVRQPDGFPTDELVTIESGSLASVANSLAEQRVIRSSLMFEILMRSLGSAKAGDYVFKQPLNVWGVAKRVVAGTFGLEPVRIRVVEGATTREMAEQFSKVLSRFDTDAFLLKARPQEGYLFPDTYFFLPNAHEDAVLEAMRQNFDSKVEPLLPDIEESGHTLGEIITMASIIEREARDPEDRRMISGVLWNRIERNMPLQVDVTFLYTIGKNTFQLTTTDLKSDHPYNTYVNKGLPPGPIGSPSLDSIRAAIRPTENSYLFYLADHSGVTHFSKTYEQHLENKRLYLGT